MGSKLVEHGEAKGKPLVLPRDADSACRDKEVVCVTYIYDKDTRILDILQVLVIHQDNRQS